MGRREGGVGGHRQPTSTGTGTHEAAQGGSADRDQVTPSPGSRARGRDRPRCLTRAGTGSRPPALNLQERGQARQAFQLGSINPAEKSESAGVKTRAMARASEETGKVARANDAIYIEGDSIWIETGGKLRVYGRRRFRDAGRTV